MIFLAVHPLNKGFSMANDEVQGMAGLKPFEEDDKKWIIVIICGLNYHWNP